MKKLAQKSKLLIIGLLVLSLLVAPILGCTATDPITDDIYIEGDLYVWDGSAWVALGGGGGDVGGLYGINVEALAGAKTLTPGTDEIYQYLDPNGGNRTITLATTGATAGDRFVIRNTDAYNHGTNLHMHQEVAVALYEDIYAGAIKRYIFDGTNWVAANIGTGEADSKRWNVAIGSQATALTSGTAVGSGAEGDYGGVAIGNQAQGTWNAVAVGKSATALSRSVAIGDSAETNYVYYSIALGYYSEAIRAGETSVNIDGNSSQKNNVVQGRWSKTTTNATPVEMFCAAYGSNRFTIRASSVLAFTMTIVARDNVAGHVAMWTVADGCIKRDAAGNTTLLSATVVEVQDESTDWTVAVTADDTNEALIITVTGDGTNATQFAARMDGVETHF